MPAFLPHVYLREMESIDGSFYRLKQPMEAPNIRIHSYSESEELEHQMSCPERRNKKYGWNQSRSGW